MTSDKILLKEAMRSKLDRGHGRFVDSKLGNDHPLSGLNQIRATRSQIDLEIQKNRVLACSLSDVLRTHSREVREQSSAIKELERLDVDRMVDSLAELKDNVEEVKDTIMCSISSLCQSDDTDC